MFQTIKNKFVVLFMILVTFTIILIGIVSDYIIQKYITRSVTSSFQEELKGKALKLETLLGTVKNDINVLSDNTAQGFVSAIESGDHNEISRWRVNMKNKFSRYLDVKQIYDRIVFIDSSGSNIVSTEDLDINSSFVDSFRKEVRSILADKQLFNNRETVRISPFRLKRKNSKVKIPPEPYVSIYRPVFNETGEKAGIILMDVSGEEILNTLDNQKSEHLTLVDSNGYYLLHSNNNIRFGFDFNDKKNETLFKYYPDHAEQILDGGSGYADTGKGWVTTWLYWFYNPGDELLVYRTFYPSQLAKDNYWVLVKSGNKKELIGTLMTMRGMMLGISSVFFAITFPVILFFGFRLTNSISRLKKAMEGFEKGEGIENLDINANDEFSDLTRSFVTMSESLYCTKMNLNAEFQRLKDLVEFSRLVGEEISEKECYLILINFLSKNFYFDRVVVISFNNSENIAEAIVSFEGKDGNMCFCSTSALDLKVTSDARLCRASRSGRKFVVNNVETDYRCRYQEVHQETGSYACFPVVTGGAVLGWIHLVNYSRDYFTDERCYTIASYINTIAPPINSIRLLNAHRKMSVLDPLTGLYNRRFLEEILDRQIAISDRYKQPLSVIMFDIDHFKKFNDTHGHSFGDTAIKTISEVIRLNVRESDTVSRYGGEEFIIVLPNTKIDSACSLAEKLRNAVENCTISNSNGNAENVTISLGVSSYPLIGQTMKDLLDTADSALYQSKAKGRNMVTRAEKGMENMEEQQNGSAEARKSGGA